MFALDAMLPLSPCDRVSVCEAPSVLYLVQFFGTDSVHFSWYELPQSVQLRNKT